MPAVLVLVLVTIASAVAAVDFDGDGVQNGLEVIAGTALLSDDLESNPRTAAVLAAIPPDLEDHLLFIANVSAGADEVLGAGFQALAPVLEFRAEAIASLGEFMWDSLAEAVCISPGLCISDFYELVDLVHGIMLQLQAELTSLVRDLDTGLAALHTLQATIAAPAREAVVGAFEELSPHFEAWLPLATSVRDVLGDLATLASDLRMDISDERDHWLWGGLAAEALPYMWSAQNLTESAAQGAAKVEHSLAAGVIGMTKVVDAGQPPASHAVAWTTAGAGPVGLLVLAIRTRGSRNNGGTKLP